MTEVGGSAIEPEGTTISAQKNSGTVQGIIIRLEQRKRQEMFVIFRLRTCQPHHHNSDCLSLKEVRKICNQRQIQILADQFLYPDVRLGVKSENIRKR